MCHTVHLNQIEKVTSSTDVNLILLVYTECNENGAQQQVGREVEKNMWKQVRVYYRRSFLQLYKK